MQQAATPVQLVPPQQGKPQKKKRLQQLWQQRPTDVSSLYADWDVGFNGGRPLKELEAEQGWKWRKGRRKVWNKRCAIFRAIDRRRARGTSKQAAVAELQQILDVLPKRGKSEKSLPNFDLLNSRMVDEEVADDGCKRKARSSKLGKPRPPHKKRARVEVVD